MKKITFDEEELFAIAVFEPGSRQETAAKMSEVLKELAEDPDMHALIVSVSEKLKRISDKDFEALDIDGYREELAWEEEYEEDTESAPATEDSGEEKRGGDDTSEGKRGGDSVSDETRDDDFVHDPVPLTSRNADEAALEMEKDGARNVLPATTPNAGGTAQKPEKKSAQVKDSSGGGT